MDVVDLFTYARAIQAIRSDEHLLSLESSAYPHVDKQAKTQIFKRHQKNQKPLVKEKVISFDDLEVNLGK